MTNKRLPDDWFSNGGNIHHKMRPQRDYSAEEKREFWAYYEAVSPAPWVFMDFGWALEAKRICPTSLVSYRPWARDENEQINDPVKYFNFHRPATDNGIILYVCNEPSGYVDPKNPDGLKRHSENMAQVMDLFGNEGRSLLAENWGTGHPDLTKLNHFDVLFDALRRWKHLHFLGMHPYYGWRGLQPDDGRLMRWKPVLDYINDPDVLLWFGEGGIDDLLDGTGKRGWKDSFTEDQYADLEIERTKTYHNHPQIVGQSTFVHGNTGTPTEPPGQGEDWDSHDWSKAFRYKQRMIAFAKEWRTRTPPPPEPEPLPKPKPPAPGDYILRRPPGESNVRSAPKRGDNVLTEVRAGDRLTVSGASVTADGYTWIAVTTHIVFGWLALLDGMTFEPVPVEPAGQLTKDDVQLLVNHYQRQAAEASRMAQFWIDFGNRLSA